MKIALVAPHVTSPGSANGPDQGPGVAPLASALGRLGHNVTVYARRDSPAQPRRVTLANRVTLEHVPAGPPTQLGVDDLAPHLRVFGDYLARRWRRRPPDVAHAHFWTSGLAALAGARCLSGSMPVVQTFHSVGTARRQPQCRYPSKHADRVRLKAYLARHVTTVLASSSEELSELAGLGVPRASMKVVPFGVDTGRFAPEGPVARRTKRPRLLTVAPPAGVQGLDVVLRALAEIPQAELVIAGDPGGEAQGGHTIHQGVAALAGQLGVTDRITFTGPVRAKNLPALLRSADLLVSAAWDEPFATVGLQAMACGTPVVASAVGCYQDAVIDGTTGALVPPEQPRSFARRIRRLLDSPVRLEAFGIAAADRARSRYSWDRIGPETVRAYERCLAMPGHDSGSGR